MAGSRADASLVYVRALSTLPDGSDLRDQWSLSTPRRRLRVNITPSHFLQFLHGVLMRRMQNDLPFGLEEIKKSTTHHGILCRVDVSSISFDCEIPAASLWVGRCDANKLTR